MAEPVVIIKENHGHVGEDGHLRVEVYSDIGDEEPIFAQTFQEIPFNIDTDRVEADVPFACDKIRRTDRGPHGKHYAIGIKHKGR